MDFEHSARTQELLERLTSFQERELEPREEDYHRELLARADPWVVLPVIEELKERAEGEGLWNLFLPPDTEVSGRPCGAGLSNVEYAPLAERILPSSRAPASARAAHRSQSAAAAPCCPCRARCS